VVVRFTPTIPHCSMATLIGLCIRVRLIRALPDRFKVPFLSLLFINGVQPHLFSLSLSSLSLAATGYHSVSLCGSSLPGLLVSLCGLVIALVLVVLFLSFVLLDSPGFSGILLGFSWFSWFSWLSWFSWARLGSRGLNWILFCSPGLLPALRVLALPSQVDIMIREGTHQSENAGIELPLPLHLLHLLIFNVLLVDSEQAAERQGASRGGTGELPPAECG